MGILDNPRKEVACPQRLPDLVIARVAQMEIGVIFNGLHKLIGDRNRNVEVSNLTFFGLAADELFNIGMVDAQHAHVGPAAATTLGNFTKGLIVDAQKADRPRRATGRGVHHIILWAQSAKGEAIAATGLLDQRGHTQGAKDAVVTLAHIVFDREDKACGQLP